MICNNKYIQDGTNQLERQSEYLKEGFVKIDERSQQDLLDFISNFSSELAYYDLNNQVNGNWQSILSDLSNLQNIKASDKQNIAPHIGLFIALTKLYKYAQDEINKITQKHLNYYYKEVLRIQSKKATPDQVQLVLNLAKSNSFDEFLLKTGTVFSAGKDKEGKPLTYKTDKEVVISRAEIKQFKTLFLDKKNNFTKIYAAPQANSIDGLGEALDEEIPFWATFGESQLTNTLAKPSMIDANIGFAISSPILLLNEGNRIIDIQINFIQDLNFSTINSLSNSFDIFYSGEEEWIEPDIYTTELKEVSAGQWQLKIHVEISKASPAFTFFNPELLTDTFETKGPVLKVYLSADSLGYDTLKQLKVESVDISVEANEMKDHLLQNETGVMNPEKPFLPFGSQPALNNNLYIGNPEIFNKKLHDLTIQIDWHEIPDPDFLVHYAGYITDPLHPIDNGSFQVNIEMLINNSWNHRLRSLNSIFDDTDANRAKEIKISEIDFNLTMATKDYSDYFSQEPLLPLSVKTNRGFIRLQLANPTSPIKAFGHKEFTKLYTEKAIALATYVPPGPVPVLPNQPYTPTIKELRLNYKSKKTLYVNNQNEYEGLIQIGPFGSRKIDTAYNREIIPLITEQGSLFIGLENFEPPQNINLLFDLEEGTGNRSEVLIPENISWHYLTQNRWIKLTPEEILADGTKGFKQSGIISLTIPKNASNKNTYLPSGSFWIKVAVTEGAEAANQIKNVFPNAVNAFLETNGSNFDLHLSTPLPEGSITTLVNKEKEIKKVEQPLHSSHGFPSESSINYYSRIRERLNHKNRSSRVIDYERMILESFPDIFKVKCLPNSNPDSFTASGSVTLIVISNLRNKDNANLFEPATSEVVLSDIENYIGKYISPFVKVYVELPIYESILIDAKIGFRTGFDPGFYSNRLNEELKQFLSPWAYEEGVDIEIGGAIYKSSILRFMESREYVDYVVDFKLYHRYSGELGPGISEMEIDLDFEIAGIITPGIGDMVINNSYIVGSDVVVACANTPKSILVSATDHRITALRPDEYVCPGASSLGIGFMTVNLDFVLEE